MSKHHHGNVSASKGSGDSPADNRFAADNASPETAGESRGNTPESGGKEENLAAGVKAEAQETGTAVWERKCAELETKLAELNDQYLRKAADLENFRKRMNREKQDLVDFANQNLLLDLLPVIDDFERAIKSAESSRDFPSFYEGVTMIEKRLSSQLESKWGLKRFDSAGEPFDPNRHEALQMEKAAGIDEPVVTEDFVKGYFLKDRVIRFAKVKVCVPLEQKGDGGQGAENS